MQSFIKLRLLKLLGINIGLDDPRYQTTRDYAVDYIMHSLPSVIVNVTLMAGLLAFVFWGSVSSIVICGWLSLSILVSFARVLLVSAYRRLPANHQSYSQYIFYYTLISFVSGLIWGAAGILFFNQGGVTEQVILYLSIVGLTSACTIVNCYWPPSFFAYAIPSVGINAIFLLWQVDDHRQLLGMLLFIYVAWVSKVAINQYHNTYQAIQLGFENRDLIEQLTIQKQFSEKANADKSRFLAAASHDLRQPLHAMQLYISSLDLTKPIKKQMQSWTGVKKSMISLQVLFNSLLDLSRLDAGMMQPNWTEFSLKMLVENFIDEYHALARQKGLRLNVFSQDVVIRSDSALLETIIRNLLSNAIRYTHQGFVNLEWQSKMVDDNQSVVVIYIEDTGIGIPSHFQNEIFNEYFQIANHERDKNNGLGLGLAIVRRLADLLDCKVSLESSVGKGSCFYVEVPVGSQATPLQSTHDELERENEYSGRDIWVIDDDVMVRDAMTLLLTKWGINVKVFEGFEDAKVFWLEQREQPNLIITDYRLRNHENGADVIARLRAHFGAHVPALIVTGDTSPERLREAHSFDIPLMHKPIEEAKLRIFISHYL